MLCFTAIDPVRPATTSATMIGEVIRGFIGFDGLLMSDDVSMGALSGTIAERAARRSRPAAISCFIATASIDEMREVAGAGARACRRRPRGARTAALAARKPPARDSISPAARREFRRHDGGLAHGVHERHDRPSIRSRRFAERGSDEPALMVDVEGFEGPLDLLLDARAPAEGRSRQDFDSGAGRPVSRLHRGGAQAAARACRRLSGDGGVAGLPQVAAAAAGARPRPRGRAPRTWRSRWPAGCAGSRRSANVAGAADGAAATRPRRFRRAATPEPIVDDQEARMVGDALRPADRLYRAAPAARASRRCASSQAHGLVAGRSARGAGAADRAGRRLGAAGRIPDRLSGRAVDARRPCWRRALRDARNGARRRRSRFTSSRPSRRSIMRKRVAAAPAAISSSAAAAARDGKRTHEGDAEAWRAVAERRIMPTTSSKPRADEIAAGQRRAPGRIAAARSAAVCRRASRSTRRRWRARLPDGVDVASALRAAAGRIRHARRQSGARRQASGRSAPPTIWPGCSPEVDRAEASCRAPRSRRWPIIAYHQPVTRAEIEEIRGVATSKGTFDVLLETGWIRLRGRRKAPGRPITYGTTRSVPVAFRPGAVGDLPGLEELKGSGLLDGRLPPASRCRCRPTIRRCATTRTRWSRAISISGWRRRRSAPRNRPLRQDVNGAALRTLCALTAAA